MGRKRKAKTTFEEYKTPKDCSETTIATSEKHWRSASANTAEAVDTKVYSTSNGSISKNCKPKVKNVAVRRSCRVMNSAPPSEGVRVEPVLGHVDLVESEREEVSLDHEANNTGTILHERAMGEELQHVDPVETVPILNQRTMEEEVPQVPHDGTVTVVNEGNLVEKLEFLVKVFGEFVSESDKQVCNPLNEGGSSYLSYKSLYIDSQKKIEGLMEENLLLSKKLEFALGKIEVYEKIMGTMCASKEVVFLPSPTPRKRRIHSFYAPVAVHGQETSSPKPKKHR